MPRTPIQQVRSWIGTWNGCDPDADYGEWMSRCYEGGQVKYITGQLERGESGNVHLQYIVQFTTAKRLNGVRAAVNDQTLGAHLRLDSAGTCLRHQGGHEDRRPVGVWPDSRFREAQGATTRPSTLLCRGRPSEGRPGVPGYLGRPRARPSRPTQAARLGRRPPLLRARGPGGVGPLGPQWHREVPLRSEALAQRRSGSPPRLSGGTDMQDRRW